MKEKIIFGITLLASVGFVWWVLSLNGGGGEDNSNGAQSARSENGFQVVEILARGGYSPRRIAAAANMPTRLEIRTKGTYDCSSALVIPSLGFEEMLPPTGVTKIDIPAQPKGSLVRGFCAMGMFYFDIRFT